MLLRCARSFQRGAGDGDGDDYDGGNDEEDDAREDGNDNMWVDVHCAINTTEETTVAPVAMRVRRHHHASKPVTTSTPVGDAHRDYIYPRR